MKIAILKYAADKNKARNYNVRPGQSVLIGASNSADIKLANTQGVAPQHCEIKYEDGAFSIKNLSKQKETILVNGAMVESARLGDQDCIEIGNNQLTVEIEDNSPKSASAGAPKPPSKAAATDDALPVVAAVAAHSPEPSASQPASADSPPETDEASTDQEPEVESGEPAFKEHPNGIRSIEMDVESGNGFQDLAQPVFVSLADRWNYGVFYNHQLSKLDSGAPSGGNLLEGNEDPYVQSNDLYFQTGEDKLELWKLFSKYAAQQAAVLCLLKKTAEPVDYAGEARMLATWLMNPTLLEFHVINGSDLLLSKIFGLVDGLVFSKPDAKKDLILINDISVSDWASLVDWAKGGPRA